MKLLETSILIVFLAAAPTMALADAGHSKTVDADNHMPVTNRLREMQMDAAKGRVLFAEKGCVVCHSVNGVGGGDATPLDAQGIQEDMNPFDLAAKMWAMAPYMIEAQEAAMGGQILFTGQELGHIVAFLHNDAEQLKFTEESLPGNIREMLEHGHDHGHGEMEEMHDD
jgi:cytochrome c553